MNAFPHQQRADRGLRPGARTLRSRRSVLVQARAMAYAVLPSVHSRTMYEASTPQEGAISARLVKTSELTYFQA